MIMKHQLRYNQINKIGRVGDTTKQEIVITLAQGLVGLSYILLLVFIATNYGRGFAN